jgi:hypothetical protein
MKHWIGILALLLIHNSIAKRQSRTKNEYAWYVKAQVGYAIGTKPFDTSWRGVIEEMDGKYTNTDKASFFMILPGMGTQLGITLGRSFRKPIAFELGIQYHHSVGRAYSQTTHQYYSTKPYQLSVEQKWHHGYLLLLKPAFVVKKNTAKGFFYSSMGFTLGLGGWDTQERDTDKNGYALGWHFGLGKEWRLAERIYISADIRYNSIYYFYKKRAYNSAEKYEKNISFSNIALNMGLSYFL